MPPATATRNETALDQAIERWNAGDLDGYLNLYDPSVRLHGYTPDALDRTEVAHFYAAIFTAFPGCSLTLPETFSDGDRLVCRFTLAGRHDGPFLGVPATGRDITLLWRSASTARRCVSPDLAVEAGRSAPLPNGKANVP